MDNKAGFKCGGINSEEIPESIIHSTGISFYKAHTDRRAMAAVAVQKKELDKDSICRVPFCVTVEAEALGAKVVVGNDSTGPRFTGGYTFTSIEQLAEIPEMDLTKGRIHEVLQSIRLLRDEGHIVALNAEGPLTILGMLLDSMVLYRGISKQKQMVKQVLQLVEDRIVKYIEAGIEHGAQIISYADPSGVSEIVGPKLYRELSGKSTCNILKRLEEKLDGAIIHLCGKTSLSMKEAGLCTVKRLEFAESLTYGEAICRFLNNDNVKILGHNCMKITPLLMHTPVVWQIELL
ncbi:MAG: uroporphyrinogen decarboxylase family protein [Veillonellales bacterium]